MLLLQMHLKGGSMLCPHPDAVSVGHVTLRTIPFLIKKGITEIFADFEVSWYRFFVAVWSRLVHLDCQKLGLVRMHLL